jgi:hypothetical protein
MSLSDKLSTGILIHNAFSEKWRTWKPNRIMTLW